MPRRSVAAAPSQPINVHTTIDMPNAAPPDKKPEEKPEFWNYMASLTQEDWKNHIVYLTRENPKTSINGIGGYLTKLQQPFDIEDIKLAYGGYEFSYIMKRGNDLAYSGRFRVEAPPKYDPSRESGAPAAAPGNGGAANVDGNILKVLEQQNERLYQVLTTLQGAKDENPAVSNALDILTSAYKTGLTAVAGNAGAGGSAGDPTKILETVLSMAERITSIRGGGGGGLSEAITVLTSLGVLTKPKTLAEQLADAKALQELIGGGGEPKDWKAAAVQAATQHLPEILDAFKAPAAAAQARATEAQARARTAETLRTVPIDRQQLQAQPSAAAAPVIRVDGGLHLEARDALPNVEVMPPAQPAPTPTSQEQYDEGLKVQIVNMFRYGASGSAIAAFLEDIKPEMAQDLKKYPPQAITEFFSQDPILKLMVADPRWPDVLSDAREFLSEDPALAPN
jgi:hypothetical protein